MCSGDFGVVFTNESAWSEDILRPRPFERQQYFHTVVFNEDCTSKRLVSTLHIFTGGLHMTYAFHLVMMAWNACKWATGLWNIKSLLQAIAIYSNSKALCEITNTNEQEHNLQT